MRVQNLPRALFTKCNKWILNYPCNAYFQERIGWFFVELHKCFAIFSSTSVDFLFQIIFVALLFINCFSLPPSLCLFTHIIIPYTRYIFYFFLFVIFQFLDKKKTESQIPWGHHYTLIMPAISKSFEPWLPNILYILYI